MTKREFFVRLTNVFVAVPFLGFLFAKHNVSYAQNHDRIYDQFKLLVDTCVPRDDFPGAVDEDIDQKLFEEISKNENHLQRVQELLSDIDKISRSQFSQQFLELGVSKRADLLGKLLTDKTLTPNQRAELSFLRAHVLQMFYISETGFAMLDYHPPSQGGYPDYARPLEDLKKG